MDESWPRRVDRVRQAWLQAWPEAAADPRRRDAMIDLHASIHAAEKLLAVARDVLPVVPTPLAGGRDLAMQIVQASWPGAVPHQVASVLPAPGRPVPRVERSEPGWLLTGTADDVVSAGPATQVLAFAVDEGDNEVVLLLDARAPGVRVGPHGASFDRVSTTSDRVAPAPGARAGLTDALTVMRLSSLVAPNGDVLARAALRAAAAAVDSPRVVRRHHDVSAAAVLVLRGVDDRLADWHRERLAPLI